MPFDLHHLLLVYTAYIVGAASPGPSNMRIMGVAMHRGRRPALMLAAGVISGSFFWGSMAATGVSAVLTQYAEALMLLKILGGAYLLFLAFKAARSALTSTEKVEREIADAPALSGWRLYQRGLLMHLTNPKALLGWVATMTLGLGAQATPQTVAVILAGCAVLSVTIFCGYALVFSTAPMIRAYRRARRWIEGTLALVYATAGLKLLYSRP
ncbi:LysE family translocator [Pseudomonas sp. CFBP 13711]|uniref:LysE family translocator n=1 Tax=unclassified Pseudomonas TaxID=196821 RepID=UPI00177AB503|nr:MULTISPECIES: LysE family translocator [unclassified Pseudomonas]MBD8708710.1 LysE family translocator [Pseudomonas sp. CFBP 13711]MBD8713792.1 LysE family translocator [Pseudomonas sp. CFBP 13715]